MKKFILILTLLLGIFSLTQNISAEQKYINFDLEGIFCPFCINLLITDLRAIPNVAEVRLSVDNKKLLIIMLPDKEPDLTNLYKTIEKDGFVPFNPAITSAKTTITKPVTPDTTNSANASNVHVNIKNQACNTCHNK